MPGSLPSENRFLFIKVDICIIIVRLKINVDLSLSIMQYRIVLQRTLSSFCFCLHASKQNAIFRQKLHYRKNTDILEKSVYLELNRTPLAKSSFCPFRNACLWRVSEGVFSFLECLHVCEKMTSLKQNRTALFSLSVSQFFLEGLKKCIVLFIAFFYFHNPLWLYVSYFHFPIYLTSLDKVENYDILSL